MSVDGVITGIKVNGEDYGGGGSSDFSTANLAVYNYSEEVITLSGGNIISPNYNPSEGDFALFTENTSLSESDYFKAFSFVLYQNIVTRKRVSNDGQLQCGD